MIDQHERQQAILAQQSFIVQAPAGSGKTSLLTQRYLSFLSTVKHPENIIAITFTKKAAAEMRERILDSLNTPPSDPTDDYQRTNAKLTHYALAQDRSQGWQITANPSRLRIMTIDAFCLMLSRQMPVAAQMIPYNQISEDPAVLYQAASQRFLEAATHDKTQHAALTTVLDHLGNDLQVFSQMCVTLLQRRDQWLGSLFGTDTARQQLLEDVQRHVANVCDQHCDPDIDETISSLMQCLGHLPSSCRFEHWQKVSKLFLTQSLSIKKRFTQRDGLPVAQTNDEKARVATLKQQCQQIAEHLNNNDVLSEQLRICRFLPTNVANKTQQQLWQCLVTLLPRLVATLHLLFAESATTDFTEITLQAMQALGSELEPSDLALRLDYDIQHLLVDEFQDTSELQYTLLKRLTAHWSQEPHKTVFFVGDPMQSIYRFREADVSLFVRTQRQGLNNIPVKPLFLSSNFRSGQHIVDLVNLLGHKRFPSTADDLVGSVTYRDSQAVRPAEADNIIAKHCTDPQTEAAFIVDYLKQHPEQDIAILVRSRRQLATITTAIQAQDIAIEGHDLVPLVRHPLVNLLWQLTQVIHSPHHTIALASLLRSPLCGISLVGLEQIAALLEQCSTQTLSNLEPILREQLNEQDYLPTQALLSWLQPAWQQQYRRSLYDLVRDTWLGLKGNALIKSTEQPIAEQFWALLENYDSWPVDIGHLSAQLNKTYSNNHQRQALKIMTIHKAKGLEFDTVILPGLNLSPTASHPSLIYWLKASISEAMLVAPIHNAFDNDDADVDFIKYIEKQRTLNEQKRLLYVALTRAKRRLVLTSHHNSTANQGSFYQDLSQIIRFDPSDIATESGSHLPSQPRYRLEAEACTKTEASLLTRMYDQTTPYQTLLGSFLHQKLQWYASYGKPKVLTPLMLDRWRSELLQLRLSDNHVAQALEHAKQLWDALQICETAQWIFNPRQWERNEYAVDDGQQRLVIDRLFEEGDTLWIIDYKFVFNHQPNGERYKEQLHEYAAHCQKLGYQAISLMLYFPLQQQAMQWQY